jgi:hypothetical protein
MTKVLNRVVWCAALAAVVSSSCLIRAESAAPASPGGAAAEETDGKKPRKEMTPEERKKQQEKFAKRLKSLREKKLGGSITEKEDKQLARMEKLEARRQKRAAAETSSGSSK